jgi:uncharacterized protein HemY
LARFLARPEAAGGSSARAKALNGIGNLALDQGDFTAARTLHEESLAIQRELHNKRGIAVSLNNLGNLATARGPRAASGPVMPSPCPAGT